MKKSARKIVLENCPDTPEDLLEAFLKDTRGKHGYGYDDTMEAFAWFRLGWEARSRGDKHDA